jgi:hypothetical protein
VTLPEMDRNRLAALLDARLAERERDDALAHLSASDEDGEVFADAAAVLRELEAEDGVVVAGETAADDASRVPEAEPADPKVVPLRPPSTRRSWRRPPARWVALAAVLVGALLVLPSRFGGRDSGDFAALLANRDDGLPRGWTAQPPPWRGTRGGGDAMIDNARAARLGAVHLALQVAAAAREADDTRLLAERAALTIEGGEIPGSGGVASTYRAIGQRAGESPSILATELAEAREYILGFVDEDYFTLGAWAEAARIAARQHDAAFFRVRDSRRMLERAASLPALDEATRVSVGALRAASTTDAEPDWRAVENHATQLLGYLGG